MSQWKFIAVSTGCFIVLGVLFGRAPGYIPVMMLAGIVMVVWNLWKGNKTSANSSAPPVVNPPPPASPPFCENGKSVLATHLDQQSRGIETPFMEAEQPKSPLQQYLEQDHTHTKDNLHG